MKKEMTTENTNEESTVIDNQESVSNPFAFESSNVIDTTSRRLDFTPALLDRSGARASELMLSLAKEHQYLIPDANTMLDEGSADKCIDLITIITLFIIISNSITTNRFILSFTINVGLSPTWL